MNHDHYDYEDYNWDYYYTIFGHPPNLSLLSRWRVIRIVRKMCLVRTGNFLYTSIVRYREKNWPHHWISHYRNHFYKDPLTQCYYFLNIGRNAKFKYYYTKKNYRELRIRNRITNDVAIGEFFSKTEAEDFYEELLDACAKFGFTKSNMRLFKYSSRENGEN